MQSFRKPPRPRRTPRSALATVALLAVLAAGCGGSSGPSSASTSPASHLTPAQLSSVLLTPADLPSWYHQLRVGGNGSAPTPCGLPAAAAAVPHAEAEFAAVGLTTSVYDGLLAEPAGQAKQILDRFSAAIAGCGSYKKVSGGRTVTYKVSALSLPAYGDQSAAVRLRTTAQRQTFQFDVVVIRKGDVLAVLGNGGLILNEDTTRSVAFKQAANLGKLPAG